MVEYEWDAELVQRVETPSLEAGEVLDHDFAASYAGALDNARRFQGEWCQQSCDIVLVRDNGNERSWAYVVAGRLPELFTDAYDRPVARVPKRFHQEVAKYSALRTARPSSL